MNNMKKILKEWRSFVKESTQPHPTSYASRDQKYFDDLNKSTKVKKKEALRIEAGYNIIRAIRGGPDQKGFMKNNKEITLSVLNQLLALSEKYDSRLDNEEDLNGPIKQRDKLFTLYITGALDGEAEPSYVVEMPMIPGFNRSTFAGEGHLTATLEILRNMINNDDYNFDLFKPGPNFVKLINNHGRGAGLGASGLTVPPGMDAEETEEYNKNIAIINNYYHYVKQALSPEDGPKPGLGDAPLPRDYYHKQIEIMKKSSAAHRWIQGAWERAIPRAKTSLDKKYAEREADSFEKFADGLERKAKSLADEISNPEFLFNKFADRNRYQIRKYKTYEIPYYENEIESLEKQKSLSADDEERLENLKDSLEKVRRRLARTEKELKDMEKTGELSPDSSVEALMAKARAGDKQAAAQAEKQLRAMKRNKEAFQMRMIKMGRG